MDEVLKENPGLNHQVAESEKFPAARRIKIYSTAYYLRILETMKVNYPKLLKEMGEEPFATLVGDYILAYPPAHYSLNHVDQHFIAFINDPNLADIALFEKKEVECFLSKDSQSMTIEQLQEIPPDKWGGLELSLIPSCLLVEFIKEEDKHVLFFRPELEVHCRVIDSIEVELIQQLQVSPRFDLLCEKAAKLYPPEDAIHRVGNHLIQWINDGIIAELR